MFQYVLDELAPRKDVVTRVIDTSGGVGRAIGNVRRVVRSLLQMLREIPRADAVSVHITTKRLVEIGPAISLLCSLLRCPYSIRIFGGEDYLDESPLRRAIARWVLRRAKFVAVETKMLIESANADGISHVVWFPNNRPAAAMPDLQPRTSTGCRRFVFMSQVKPSKGILEVIEAGERLDGGALVDVYGPMMEGITEAHFQGLERVHYRGSLPPERVMSVLQEYDALLLPTYYKAEGYPGVILESLMAGTPVVCTRWRALPEVIDESCGVLVEPRDADSLYEAMKKLVDDRELHSRLLEGARAKRLLFDSGTWCERFVEYCAAMVDRK